ncbi:alpha-amylase family glycosyl hydrolase [Acidicapsa acidisoli]|uniref:alpha-amylase family glycosyl hydrolase n=1 Tax=Acidicapsa acidisoli TaxID=1615681 RepID=UPI0021E018F7|nr:alpha-amylase family glycosyl hydrolase [Acidicapsa acidisoli]
MSFAKYVNSFAVAFLAFLPSTLFANDSSAPAIAKIDPPNWWAAMPKPMLLVQGEHLSAAHFTLSDSHLHIDQAKISANGHWAELWLNASPAKAETLTIDARTPGGDTSREYRFEERRSAADGFAGFSSRDAMYLIMTDRFADGDLTNDGGEGTQPESSAEAATERSRVRGWHGGDLRGITQHLDYIQQLGFTTVWMTPVYANRHEPDSYHGYGATDMYAVDPHYGTLADLQALAAELHRRQMKLVLDTVPNHVGPKNVWVDDEPDPDWLHGTKADHHEAVGEFRPLVDPHAPWRDQQYVLQGWFANTLPDLNQENPATSQYLIQNAMWWIEQTGADGLRIDTFPYVGRAFWHDFHAQIHGIYPKLTTVGEVYNCDATITSSFAGGVTRNGVDTGLDTPFDFPSFCALRDVFFKDEPMSHLTDVWRLDALFPHPERLIPFLGNHDNSRFLSNKGATPENMRLAFTILLTMRGMPQIYSGDEIAMQGGDDPDNRRDFPGGWPEATQSAFTGRTPEQAVMHDWVQNLLTMRAKYAALQTGEMQVLAADKDVLAYTRVLARNAGEKSAPGGKVLVVVNRAATDSTVNLKLGGTLLEGASQSHTVLGDAKAQWDGENLRVEMAGTSAWIAVID